MKRTNRQWFLGLALVGGLGSQLVPSTAAASDVKLTDAAFKYNGVRYFRGKSENIDLGSFGEKKTPLGQVNYLAVQNKIAADKLDDANVRISGPYSINWSKFSDREVNAAIKYLKAGGGTGSFSRDAAKSADLKLVKFHLDEGPLKGLLNTTADGARNYLADEGGDGRIVSEVWVVMEAELASEVTRSGTVAGAASGGGFKVRVGGGGSSTSSSTVTVPRNTTFAYLMHKVKDWKNGKSKVDDLEDDQHGVF